MLDFPYVGVAEFRAHPTFLDTNNLRGAASQTAQDQALLNALLTASQWADDTINMPLAAHVRVENARVRPDRLGRLRYHPEHAPVIAVTGIATGPDPTDLTAVTAPAAWLEQDGRIIVAYGPTSGTGLDSLQFGRTPTSGEVLVQWTYTAGFPATQLAAAAAAAASTVVVNDATGILPGTVLRLWTPGLEEAVTVTSVAGATLHLAAPLVNSHPLGMSCSALPTTARQAVINYATAVLMRPAAPAQDNPALKGPSPGASAKDPQRATGGAGLIAEAVRLLNNFTRVR